MGARNRLCACALALALAGSLFAAGCIEQVPVEGRPCPCGGGWKCCLGAALCIPLLEYCPAGQPCDQHCEDDQWCYDDGTAPGGICYSCVDNKHCGVECLDCTASTSDWACVDGTCGCRFDPDCPPRLPCRDGVCQADKPDGGTDGGMDAGTDGGVEDGGTDGGLDGGDTVVYNTNKACGQERIDCTGLDSGWACVDGTCGCLGPSDCLPDQTCQADACVAR